MGGAPSHAHPSCSNASSKTMPHSLHPTAPHPVPPHPIPSQLQRTSPRESSSSHRLLGCPPDFALRSEVHALTSLSRSLSRSS
jgi:hypothetical protein